MKDELKKKIISAIVSFFIVFTNCINLKYIPAKPLENLKNNSWVFGLILFIALYKFIKSRISKIKKPILIISTIMSIIYVISFYLDQYQTISYAFISIIQLFKTIFVIVGYTIFTYFIIDYTFEKLKKIKYKDTKNKIIDFLFNKHPFISSFIIVLIFYIPILYIFYPGVLMADGLDELRQYNHVHTWSLEYINLIDPGMYINGHHSPFHTVILGFVFNLFKGIGGVKFGVFGYVLLQVLLQALILSYSIRLMKKLNVCYFLRIMLLICYSLLPWFSVNSVGVYKDIMFSYFILLLICYLIEYTYLNENKIIDLVKLIVCSIIVILLTNKGIYIVGIITLLLIIKYWKKKLVVILLLIPILFNSFYNKLLLPALHVTPGSIQETLSLPIQQVSRYIVYYENDITDEEKNNISSLLDYNNISKRYNPGSADPIKNNFNINYTKKAVKNFLKTWVTLFFKHPGVYINAFGNMYYKYLYYDSYSGISYFESNVNKNKDDDNIIKTVVPKGTKKSIRYIRDFWLLCRRIPIIGAILNVAFYNWLLILMIMYIIVNKDWKKIIPFIPAIVVLMFCFVSPVNGNKRYVYPIIYSTPMLISYVSVLHYKKIEKN